jgi:hypothetical protein
LIYTRPALRREESRTANIAKRELEQRVVELKGDFESEQKTTFEITADMTRQYKGMQEELLGKVNLLENTIAELKDELGKGVDLFVGIFKRSSRALSCCSRRSEG